MIGIKFLLSYGHYVQTPVSEDSVSKFFVTWQKAVESNIHTFFSGTTTTEYGSVEWCVSTKEIVGIHTFPLELLGAQQAQPNQDVLRGSGYVPSFGKKSL